MKTLLLALLLAALPVKALADFHLLELDELSVNYKNFAMVNDKARNSLIYPEHPKEGLDLILKTTVASYFYLEPTVESLTTGSQYRAVGLNMRLGLRVSDSVDLGYWHHSQHLLDREHSYMGRFPSEDAVELRVYIFRTHTKPDTVF